MFILLALFPIFFLLGLHFSFVRFRDTRISRVINIKAKQNTHTLLKKNYNNKATWSYENRFGKHFLIFLNFPCLIACLLSCPAYVIFFSLVLGLGICVEVDVDRITILPHPPFFSFC